MSGNSGGSSPGETSSTGADPRRTYQCGFCGRRVELTPERAAAILWDCDRCMMAQSLVELPEGPPGDELVDLVELRDEELPANWRLLKLRPEELELDPDEELDPYEF